ncbi:MAG: ATP-binding protein [Myxococcaceae bacterium]|nr:ATP-binding protein [Myxococcaceae bacterium]
MPSVLDSLTPVLKGILGRNAERVLKTSPAFVNSPVGSLDVCEVRELLVQLDTAGKLYTPGGQSLPLKVLRDTVTLGGLARPNEQHLKILTDTDVLSAQRATQFLVKGYFSPTECVRLATAVSELARNMYMYASGGDLTLKLAEEPNRVVFTVVAEDHGPGIPQLDLILSGGYRSRTGLGRGLLGVKALLDQLHIETNAGQGTRIKGSKAAKKP